MSTRFYETDLTDAAWALVAPVLPAARPGGRPRTTNLRAVLNADSAGRSNSALSVLGEHPHGRRHGGGVGVEKHLCNRLAMGFGGK